MAHPASLRETLTAWCERGSDVRVTVYLPGSREVTGQIRAVTTDTLVIGNAEKPYYVALAHIVWMQEQ